MSELLFEDFEKVSSKQWKQKIQFELNGEDYNEKLVTKTRDGINIKPFYHADDLKEIAEFPFPNHWEICEKIYVVSENKSNKKALQVLQKGAESIWFILSTEKVNLSVLFANIDFDNTTIYIGLEFLSEDFLNKLKEFVKGSKHHIFLQNDIIGNLARTGNFYYNLKEDHRIFKSYAEKSNFKGVISIDGTLYQNAGATVAQELAYCMAHANEYFNLFSESVSVLNREFHFLISTGTNYFFEIAKIRALRLLYSSVASEYRAKENCHILAQPTKRDKTLYDYNVNLLRTTMQSMSAIFGGADSISNLPYDAIYHKNNEFGDRIARNQLLVLKNESYLDKVSNAAQGAYYIEDLSIQLAQKALEIFKEIESGGGFMKQLKDGIIQKKIEESAIIEQERFDNGEIVLIGSNKFINPEDLMKNDLELYPFLKTNPRKTLIKPIFERRLTENLEKARLENE